MLISSARLNEPLRRSRNGLLRRHASAEAIRLGRFDEAARGLALLTPTERSKPEVRLASASGRARDPHPAEALAALDKLDELLPLVRELVAKLRAQAMFEVDSAAEWFGTRRDVGSLVQAAEAWEKVGDATKARAAWDRVVTADKRSRAQEERARSRRLAITRLKDGDPAAGVERLVKGHPDSGAPFEEREHPLESSDELRFLGVPCLFLDRAVHVRDRDVREGERRRVRGAIDGPVPSSNLVGELANARAERLREPGTPPPCSLRRS